MGARRVTEAKRLEFRAALLELGVIRQASKVCKIPLGTCFGLAKELERDETFVQQRADLRAQVLPKVEALLLECAAEVGSRVLSKDLSPRELAQIAVDKGLKSFTYQNPKPQYFRGLVDFYKALGGSQRGAKPPEDGSAHVPANVTINIHGPGGVLVANAGA